MKKKSNTTKRLSKGDLERLKTAIRKGVRSKDLIRLFKVSGSTIAYHKDQIRKSDAIDKDIEAHEASENARESVTTETLDDLEDPRIKALEKRIHGFIDTLQALSLERDKLSMRVHDLQTVISDLVLKQKSLTN